MKSVEIAFCPVQNIVCPPQKTVLRTPAQATYLFGSLLLLEELRFWATYDALMINKV